MNLQSVLLHGLFKTSLFIIAYLNKSDFNGKNLCGPLGPYFELF